MTSISRAYGISPRRPSWLRRRPHGGFAKPVPENATNRIAYETKQFAPPGTEHLKYLSKTKAHHTRSDHVSR